MTETLLVIEDPPTASWAGFYAGVVAQNGKVVEVAPILYRHIKRGWTGQQVVDYCKAKGWRWERVYTQTQ